MFDKLEEVEKRYEELNKLISDPEIIADQNSFKKYMKEQSMLVDVVEKFREYKKVKEAMEDAEELMSDPEMKEIAEAEYYENKEKIKSIDLVELNPLRDVDKKTEKIATNILNKLIKNL